MSHAEPPSSFLVRPKALLDESLSSWRQRTAWANGYMLFPVRDERTRRRDPDISLSGDETRWVSRLSTKSEDDIRSMTIQYHPLLRKLNTERSRHLIWVVSPKAAAGVGAHGAMFCPHCLATDEVPYFRWHWRMAFLNACPIHNIQLIDQCPKCQRPPWPAGAGVRERIAPGFQSLDVCWHCGVKLTESRTERSSGSNARTLRQWLESESVQLGASFLIASEVLLCLRAISHLFLRNRTHALIASTPGFWSGAVGALSPAIQRTLYIEMLDISDRELILKVVLSILENWPDSFVEFCRTCGISRAHFNGTDQLMPLWMKQVIDDKLALQNRSVNPQVLMETVQTWLDNRGQLPSKTQVRKLLNWQGSRGLNIAFQRRAEASMEEWRLLRDEVKRQNLESLLRSDRRIAFLRDMLLLTCSAKASVPLRQITVLSMESLYDLAANCGTFSVLQSLFHIETQEVLNLVINLRLEGDWSRQAQKRLTSLMENLPADLIRSFHVFQRQLTVEASAPN